MIVLDENIQHDQWAALRSGRVRARLIGHEVGRAGLQDEEIIPFLLTLRRPTFFTRDADFYRPRLRHRGYCLVYLAIAPHEVARYVRRFLRHPALATQAARL